MMLQDEGGDCPGVQSQRGLLPDEGFDRAPAAPLDHASGGQVPRGAAEDEPEGADLQQGGGTHHLTAHHCPHQRASTSCR